MENLSGNDLKTPYVNRNYFKYLYFLCTEDFITLVSDEWGGPHVRDKDSASPDARGGSYHGSVRLAELHAYVMTEWVTDITCCCKC